jgi:hypothetical protein
MLRVMSAAEREALHRVAEAQRELARREREFAALHEREIYRARRAERLSLVHSTRQPRHRASHCRQ